MSDTSTTTIIQRLEGLEKRMEMLEKHLNKLESETRDVLFWHTPIGGAEYTPKDNKLISVWNPDKVIPDNSQPKVKTDE